jgi:hypothetical protein
MKLIKYKSFVNNLQPINENIDRAKKLLKDRYTLHMVAKELGFLKGELGEQLKHGEKKSLTLRDFTTDQQEKIRSKMREMKLSEETIRQIEHDPEFIKLRELLKDNLGYMFPFTYMYYIEMVPFEEIKSMYDKIIQFNDLLGKMPKRFDANFIDFGIPNNAEVLSDGLDYLENYRKIKRVFDKLTPELKKDYNDSPVAIKDQFQEIARGFDELGKDKEGEKEKLWRSFFGELKDIGGKKVYSGQLKRYKNIRDFIKAAQNFLKASSNSDMVAFYDKINNCNEKYGQQGADIVFDESGILILEVKSFQSNQLLNGHTRHCIKDSMHMWDSYVSGHNNKQYYIYNFNIPQYDNMSVIGITIEPSQKIRACHRKDDGGVGSEIKKVLHEWEKKYKIKEDLFSYLKPMSKEEVAKRERAKLAEREIVKKGLSIEQIIRYVKEDGANINKNNCIALENAVEEDDIEKSKVILELGGNPNLKNKNEAIVNKAKSLDMVKLLVEHHAELTGEVFNNICHDLDAVEYCLKQGLNPNFENLLPVRKCCKGSWKSKDDIGESYFKVFELLVKYGARLDENGRNMSIKWAAEYHRFDMIDYMIKNKKSTDEELVESLKIALGWLKHSRKINDKYKNEVIKYLEIKIKEFS